MTPEPGVRLAPHTSLRVGGPADWYLAAASAQEVAEGLRWAADHGEPVRVIGGGSNLLVADNGVDGLVIRVAFGRTEVQERAGGPVLVAQAGANLANSARRLAKQDLGGLEWAANVPGTVGGAAVNNAGAFGGDTASCLVGLTVVESGGRRTRLGPDELQYGYRTSLLKRREMGDIAVESVEFGLRRCRTGEADTRVKAFNEQRMRSQPRILSAGSVFANPRDSYAGLLIEQAGLKGERAGGAQISEQHANFIVNPGGATAEDVFSLMRRAQTAVFERTGTWLRAEIELLGRWSPEQRAGLAGPLEMAVE